MLHIKGKIMLRMLHVKFLIIVCCLQKGTYKKYNIFGREKLNNVITAKI